MAAMVAACAKADRAEVFRSMVWLLGGCRQNADDLIRWQGVLTDEVNDTSKVAF